jgi:hypothetical protein
VTELIMIDGLCQKGFDSVLHNGHREDFIDIWSKLFVSIE